MMKAFILVKRENICKWLWQGRVMVVYRTLYGEATHWWLITLQQAIRCRSRRWGEVKKQGKIKLISEMYKENLALGWHSRSWKRMMEEAPYKKNWANNRKTKKNQRLTYISIFIFTAGLCPRDRVSGISHRQFCGASALNPCDWAIYRKNRRGIPPFYHIPLHAAS